MSGTDKPSDTAPKGLGIWATWTPDQWAEFFKIAAEAEAPCSLCGGIVLAGGCQSGNPQCPQYQEQTP
jgi:hypothetical protein